MLGRVLKCPQCNASLTPPSQFARSVVCSFCSTTVMLDHTAVSAQRYRDAHRAWVDPGAHGFNSWASIGGSAWAPQHVIAHGEISDVYEALRASWPTEHVLLKVLRDPEDAPLFEREWEVTGKVRTAVATTSMATCLPDPIAQGTITAGFREGARALVYRWAPGFKHSLEQAHFAHPSGVDPRIGLWMWRRVLELLALLHKVDVVHGAILPRHLLVQEREHGIRLVGFCCAGSEDAELPLIQTDFEAFYPSWVRATPKLSRSMDLAMSARCIAWILGGDPSSGDVPDTVPTELGAVIRAVTDQDARRFDAWSLREHLGDIARKVFGPPSFHPLVIPKER